MLIIVYYIFVPLFFICCGIGYYFLDTTGGRGAIKEIEQEVKQEKEHEFIAKKLVNRIDRKLKGIGGVLVIPLLALARHQFLPPEEKYGDKVWEKWLEKRMVIGRIIIYTMAVGNILFSIPVAIVMGEVLYFLFQVVFSILLIRGFNWMRILFGLGALGVASLLLTLAIQYIFIERDMGAQHYLLVIGIFAFVGGLLLLFNKSVRIFNYYK